VLDKDCLHKLSLKGMKLSTCDLGAFGKIEEQYSLKVLKLAELTLLGENLLPEFLGRLRKLESLGVVDRTGKMIQSIGLSIGRLQNLRKLSLFTHHPQRLSFLPFLLPSLPHLRFLALHDSTLQVDFTPAFLTALSSITNGEV
jgi:hypothetical protein